jgi:hypothetical protein
MFGRFRRNRKVPEGQVTLTASLSPQPAPRSISRLAVRQVGTTPEDRALLAQLLLSPPAWDNSLPVTLASPATGDQPFQSALTQPEPMPYLSSQGGDGLSKGGARWDAAEPR